MPAVDALAILGLLAGLIALACYGFSETWLDVLGTALLVLLRHGSLAPGVQEARLSRIEYHGLGCWHHPRLCRTQASSL